MKKKPKLPAKTISHSSDSHSAVASDEYRKNFDKVFGKKK